MKNRIFNRNSYKRNSEEKTLKTTALRYLREALYNEEYEKCPELIGNAKAFGATPEEVAEAIDDYIWGSGFNNNNEAENVNEGGTRYAS